MGAADAVEIPVGECSMEESKPSSLKDRAARRRDRLRSQLQDIEAFLNHLEAHPELEAFAEAASRI